MTTRRIFLLAMATYFILATTLFLVMPQLARAQDGSIDDSCKIGTKEEKEAAIRVGIFLPGVTQKVTISDTESYNAVKNLSCYLSGFYRYFAGVAGILATVMIMYGGVQYVISFGNPSRLQTAKDTIFSALIGLVITLGSYIILYTINPNLVTLELPSTASISTQFQGTNWCLTDQNPTPKVAGATSCGDVGVYSDNRECVYRGNCSASGDQRATCVPEAAFKNEPGDSFVCMLPQVACDLINDQINNKDLRLTACSFYSATDISYPGICVAGEDFCEWKYKLTCPRPYTRASCAECNAVQLTQCYSADGQYSVPLNDAIVCDESISETEDVYERQTVSGSLNLYVAICCKYDDGTPPPAYSCKASFSPR